VAADRVVVVPPAVFPAVSMGVRLWSSSMETYTRFVEAGGVERVVHTLMAHKEEVVVHTCMHALAVTYCAWSAVKRVPGGDLDFQFIGPVVSAMSEHVSCAKIQHHACWVLAVYSRNCYCFTKGLCGYDPYNYGDHERKDKDGPAAGAAAALQTICAFDGVRAVVRAMTEHKGDVGVQGSGCHALGQFLRLKGHVGDGPGGIAAIVAVDGLHVAIEALRAHSEGATVMRLGCWVLGMLCWDVEHRATFIAAGGAQFALSSLQSEGSGPQDSQVYQAKCNAAFLLMHIAKDGMQGVDDITARGGVSVLVQAMAADKTQRAAGAGRPTSSVLMQNASTSLLLLLSDDARCESFALHGGIQVVVECMKSHKKQVGLLRLMKLLGRLAQVESLVMSVAVAGGTQAVLEFMEVRRAGPLANGHATASEILQRLAQGPSLQAFMKGSAGVRQWLECALIEIGDMPAEARQRYTELVQTLT